MNVAAPITAAIPSLDGPVLAALSRTNAPLTLTRVHELTGRGSIPGVRKVLLRLVDTGLVHAVPGGYVLNREHLAAAAVEALAGAYGELHRRIRDAVVAWGGSFVLIGLFGSAARRDGDEGSDIDVLLLSDDARADDFGGELSTRVRAWTGNDAHVVVVTRAKLRTMRAAKAPIVASWQRELVLIAGDAVPFQSGAL